LKPLHARVVAFLADHHVLSLATCADGDLWAANVFYATSNLDLVFVSSPHARHSGHLDRCPRVAATIHSDHTDWRDIRGIQLEGTATRLGRDVVGPALDTYLARFPWARDFLQTGTVSSPPSAGEGPDAPALVSMVVGGREVSVAVYRLRPARLLLLDNRLGFGHREELRLELVDDHPGGRQHA
jgi:uncharacterized protein